MSFSSLLVASVMPVLKICLMASVGIITAKTGLLNKEGQKYLGRLNFAVFTPTLILDKLGPAMSLGHLARWWPIPINIVLSVSLGLLLGYVQLPLVKPPSWFRNHVIIASGLGNVGNLPLVLVAALIKDLKRTSPQWASVGISDDLGMAYVALGIWVATITHFTIGYNMLKPSAKAEEGCRDGMKYVRLEEVRGAADLVEDHEANVPCQSHPALEPHVGREQQAQEVQGPGTDQSSSELAMRGDVKAGQDEPGSLGSGRHHFAVVVYGGGSEPECLLSEGNPQEGPEGGGHQLGRSCTGTELQMTMMAGTTQGHVPLDSFPGDPNGTDNDRVALMSERPADSGGGPLPRRRGCSWRGVNWKGVISRIQGRGPIHVWDEAHGAEDCPSGWCRACHFLRASLLPLVRDLLTPPILACVLSFVIGAIPWLKSALFEPDGQLRMLGDINKIFGQCCIPTLMMLVGATLEKGPGSAPVPLSVIMGVTLSRLVVLPLVGTMYLMTAFLTGMFHPPDPIFMLVMLIQNSVPTALNVQTLTVIHQHGEKEMSCIIFWQYLVSILTVPLFLMLYLHLAMRYLIPR